MPSDTFAIQRDVAFYVARLASERAIALLRQKLFGTAGIVALVGPPGIGKSVIAERAARGVERKVTCVRLRLEGRSSEELCEAVVSELGAATALTDPAADQSESPAARMRQWVRSEAEAVRSGPERALVDLAIRLRRAGRPLTLFIDDADAIADRTVVRLHELATSSRSIAICLVLADEREFEGLPKKLVVIRYDEPMSLSETTAYVNARLMRGESSPELRQLLDDAMIRRVHAYSGGIPRRVHAEIALLMSDARVRETARQDASLYPVVESATPVAEADVSFELPSRARLRWLTLGAAGGSVLSAVIALALVQFAPDLIRLRPGAQPALRAGPAEVTSDFEPGAPTVVAGDRELRAEDPGATPPAEDAENVATAPRRRTPVAEDDPAERSSRLQAVARADSERSATAPRKAVGTAVAATTPPPPAPVPAKPAPRPRVAEPTPAPASAPAPAPTQAAAAAPVPVAKSFAQPADKPQLFYADVNAVPRALITIDGVEIGQTPLGGLPLEEGIHQFRAVMPDGRVLERAILISKDRQRILFE